MTLSKLLSIAAFSLSAACPSERSEPGEDTARTRWSAEDAAAPSGASSAPRPPLPPIVPLSSVFPEPPLPQAELKVILENKDTELTRDAYETVLLLFAECEQTGRFVPCEAERDLDRLIFRSRTPGWTRADVGLEHLRHPSAAVRSRAARDVGLELFGPSSEKDATSDSGRAFLGAMRSETTPRVLGSMLRVVRGGAHKSPVLRELIRGALDHEDSTVRSAAVSAMTSPKTYAEVADARQLILAKLTKDPADHVRGAACAGLGLADDPDVLESIAGVMEDPATPVDVRGACFEGVVATWTSDPEPRRPSRAGYELTMKVLLATPRTEDWPHNRGIMALTSMRRSDPEWVEKVKDFHKDAEIVSALESIALDVQAGELARDVALFTLGILGEKGRLTKLATVLGARTDSRDRSLARAASKAATE